MSRIFSKSLCALDETLSLVFQNCCLCCQRLCGPHPLCDSCVPIVPVEGPLCLSCGTKTSQSIGKCGQCEVSRSALAACRSALWLTDHAKVIVHRIKYAGRFEWLDIFKETALDYLDPFFPRDVTIVPVPLHPSRFFRRGFNQSEVLAHWIACHLDLPMISNGLLKKAKTVAQSTLRKGKRRENLKRSFAWNKRVRMPEKILLIDDIYTTGATLEACARVFNSKTHELYAWTLFRTPSYTQVATYAARSTDLEREEEGDGSPTRSGVG